MLAARNGNPDAVRVLLEGGAKVNAKETLRGTTALMWAAEQKHPEAVKALLAGGADFAAKSGGAGLPRNYLAPRVNTAVVKASAQRYARAAAAGRTYEEQLKWEQANGQDTGPPSIGDQLARIQQQEAAAAAAGATAAARCRRCGAGRSGCGQAAAANGRGRGGAGRGAAPAAGAGRGAAAVEEESDDNEVVVAGLVGSGGGGLTALVFAAREGDLASAKLLLDAGADINQTTEYGWTPLLTATNNRHYAFGKFLLERGADPNKANKGGWTPLYLATDNRNIEGGDYPVPKPDMDHLEYIKLLLGHGADPNGRVRDNTLTRTIFTMQWFYEDGCTPFVRAAQSSDSELMQLLLDWGADPFIATAYADTALTAAAGIGWVEGVTYERSPKDNLDAVKMLVYLGLDVNAANRDGRTPLMGAALKGRNDVVQFLVDHGAKPGSARRRQPRHARGVLEAGRPHLAGDRLRRRPGARRRAVGRQPSRDRRADSQDDDGAEHGGPAAQPRRRLDLRRVDLPGAAAGGRETVAARRQPGSLLCSLTGGVCDPRTRRLIISTNTEKPIAK